MSISKTGKSETKGQAEGAEIRETGKPTEGRAVTGRNETEERDKVDKSKVRIIATAMRKEDKEKRVRMARERRLIIKLRRRMRKGVKNRSKRKETTEQDSSMHAIRRNDREEAKESQ